MSTIDAIELKPSDTAFMSKGKSVYRYHCAACHGCTLKGQRNCESARPTEDYQPHPMMRVATLGTIRDNSCSI